LAFCAFTEKIGFVCPLFCLAEPKGDKANQTQHNHEDSKAMKGKTQWKLLR
jgi:hypothetical protein